MTTTLAVLDLETTGVDPETARIVTAYLGIMTADGEVSGASEWLVDPGIEIPEGATAVHGITTEHAHTHGIPAGQAIAQIEQEIAGLLAADLPLVVYNAAYDLTVLDRESGRHWGGPGPTYGDPRPVIDPLILDTAIDRYRKGSRTLAATAAHYGISRPEGDAHSAAYDAILAGRLALRLLEHPKIVGKDLAHLHARSIALAQDRVIRLRDYHRSIGRDVSTGYRSEWPVVPRAPE